MEETVKLQNITLKSVWGLASLSLISLLLTKELGLLEIFLIFIFLPFGFYFELKGKLFKKRWLENSLILFLFVLTLFLFLGTKRSFLIVIADFLIGFILLKCTFKKDRKDIMQIIALSFFILLSASTLALDFSYFLCFIFYVLSAAWTLTFFSLTEKNLKTIVFDQKEQAKTPEIKTLYKFIAKNCWLTLGLVFIFSIAIFIFFPRMSLAVFQGAFLGPVQTAGISDKMHLVQSGKIFEDPAIVMRVEIQPQDRNRLNSFFIRGQTLSSFDGIEWKAEGKKGKSNVQDAYMSRVLKIQKIIKNDFKILDWDRDALKKEFGLNLNERSFLTQKIYLESLNNYLIFGLPWIDFLSAKLPEVTILEDHAILRPPNFGGRLFYEARSLIERPKETLLSKKTVESGIKWEDQEIIEKNLKLPKINLEKIKDLAQEIVSEKEPPYIKAKKIERYLSKNYTYALNIKTKNFSNPTEEFLFKTKAGHCEYFASAMALMLRLENIPTRIATGFILNEWNPSGNYYTVRFKDAHSWVEVYIGGLWIEFDPSPRNYVPDLAKTSLLGKIKEKMDYWNFLWNAYILGYDMESQKKLAKTVEFKSNQLSSKLDRTFGNWRSKYLKAEKLKFMSRKRGGLSSPELFTRNFLWFLAFVLFIGVGVGLGTIVLYKKMKFYLYKYKIKKTLPNIAFYLTMLKILKRFGFNKRESETPYEFLYKLQKNISPALLNNELDSSLVFLTELFYKARFSTLITNKEETSNIKKSLELLRHQLKKLKIL
ncbi:MAG: hypothetical protein A3I11_01935 [Elusimicrobia bacterium RIFCSPLOWO2_02_FULL_39_32]|nr:MAG: hypothetical protein A3B80_06820 [Elusimicrobia bacterium RIFCSPHIGHO2_02_FULL_39_36]OGR92140.1 MAG: hypothetical protein A3I11_01935 [Elusimicrobia bacterium RIFCSPLOWO2_02_FULL_39_32]OGR99992.1 MAG: hypothetical protein A3G85_03500 [Elusimicrobia bacterium RIFCSPLOWO2_12_FULL_39_28]